MTAGGLEIVDGAAGAWIEPELNGEVGSVIGSVPNRFPAYVRTLHPVQGANRNSLSWAKVAEERGTRVHPLVQWVHWSARTGISKSQFGLGASRIWEHFDPYLLEALCEILGRHTSTTERCFFGIWEGGHTT